MSDKLDEAVDAERERIVAVARRMAELLGAGECASSNDPLQAKASAGADVLRAFADRIELEGRRQ